MAYQFRKLADGSYEFIVYNTGAGVNNHLGKSKIKNRYSPLKVFHIPKDEHVNERIKSYIAELMLPKIAPLFNNITNTDEYWTKEKRYDADRIYKEVIPKVYQLGTERDPVKEVDPARITPMTTQGQLSGTCSMRVIMPILHTHLKGFAFQQFLYQLRLQSLWDHYQIQKNLGHLGSPIIQRQLEAARSKLARTTRKMMLRTKNGKQVLEESSAKETLRMLDHIAADLKEQAAKNASDLAKLKQPLNIELNERDEIHFVQPFRRQYKALKVDLPPKLTGEGDYELTTSEMTLKELKTAAESSKAVHKIPLPKIDQFKNPGDYLAQSLKVLEANNKTGISIPDMMLNLEAFFLSLPLDTKETSEYWKNLGSHPQDVKMALSSLQRMLRLYGEYCGKRDSTRYPMPRQILTERSALLSASFICTQFFPNNPKLANFSKLLRYTITGGNANNRELSLITLDPKWDKRAQEIADIFKSIQEIDPNQDSWASINSKDYYDYYFIDQLDKASKTELEKTFQTDAKDHFDQMRMNLFRSAMNQEPSSKTPLMEKILSDYDILLQFKQMIEESNNFEIGEFDYFEGVGQRNPMEESTARRQALKMEKSTYSYERDLKFSDDLRIKTNYSFEFRYLPPVRQKRFFTDLLQSNLLRTIPFSMTSYENLETINAIIKKFEENREYFTTKSGFGSRRLSLARHSNNEFRTIITKEIFESNLELFEDIDTQSLFLANIFSPSSFTRAISKHPNLANDLMELLLKGFRFNSRAATQSFASVFCLEAMLHLQKYLKADPNREKFKEIISRLNKTLDKEILSSIAAYQEKLACPGKYKDEKSYNKDAAILQYLHYVHYIRIGTLKKPDPSFEDLKTLFLGILNRNFIEPNLSFNAFMKFEVNSLRDSMTNYLEVHFESLTTEQKNDLVLFLINKLLVPALLPESNVKFVISFPNVIIHHTKMGALEINLVEGTLKSSQERLGYIPEKVQSMNYTRFLGLYPKKQRYVKRRII